MDERYKLAFDEAVRSVAHQDETLGNLRTRSGGLLATATVLATFASGLGLFSTEAGADRVLPTWVAATLLALVVAIGVCSMLVLAPRTWKFSNNPELLIKDWIEARPKPASIDALHRGIAIHTRRHYEANHKKLQWLHQVYRTGIVLLLAETVVLVSGLTFFS